MSAWLDTITNPLNAASQSLQKLMEIRDTIKFGEEVGKLHAQILSAMQGAIAAKANESALLDQISDLKKKVTALDEWNADKDRYELVALAPNIMARSLKDGLQENEPEHYICANCYNDGKKRYLKQTLRGSPITRFECNECKDIITIDDGTPPRRHNSLPPRRGGSWMGV